MTLWNPTLHPVTIHPRVPVTREYLIRDPNGAIVPAEYLPVSEATKKIPGRMSTAQHQYLFQASLPALGYSTYYFEATRTKKKKIQRQKGTTTANQACVLQSEHLRVEFDERGHSKHIVNLDKDLVVSFTEQGFYWYASYPGNPTTPELPASGAYIFRPLFPESLPVSLIRNINSTITETVQRASIVFNDWISQEFNLYRGVSALELEWTVGPILVEDNVGKEIVLRYDTDIESAAKYYTDANGREVLERIRNHRPTWPYVVDEPITGNYYPINSRIWIRDRDRQLTDSSLGSPLSNEHVIFTTDYELRLNTSSCFYVDEKTEEWKSDGMKVGPNTTHFQTQCLSTHV